MDIVLTFDLDENGTLCHGAPKLIPSTVLGFELSPTQPWWDTWNQNKRWQD
jgi:hypothetical protein